MTLTILNNPEKIEHAAVYAAPYIFSLYFLEIIYFLPAVIYLYGKPAGTGLAAVLSAALTFHLFFLYLRKNISRMIHLIIMDLHAAFSIGYIVNYFFTERAAGISDSAAFAVRIILLAAELLMIVCLTSERAKKLYS